MKNINKELEIVLINGEPRVNLSQLAEILGIVHKSALNTIYKYEAKLKQKGELVFKKQGRKKKYFLNEAQFLFFISLSKNTKVAVELKSNSFDNFMKIWVSSRLGLITGSDTPFTTKGLPIPNFEDYVNKKVAEKFFPQKKSEFFQSKEMKKGVELEELAIRKYEKQTGKRILKKSFVYTDFIGASTDGIREDGINIEVKNVIASRFIGALTDWDAFFAQYKAQVHVEMYLLKVDETDFIVQCQDEPNFPLIVRRIQADEQYMKNMIATIEKFEILFNEKYEAFKKFVQGTKRTNVYIPEMDMYLDEVPEDLFYELNIMDSKTGQRVDTIILNPSDEEEDFTKEEIIGFLKWDKAAQNLDDEGFNIQKRVLCQEGDFDSEQMTRDFFYQFFKENKNIFVVKELLEAEEF